MTLLFDTRWSGQHGIGRFSTEVAQRIPHIAFPRDNRPMSPFDPVRLAIGLLRASPNTLFYSPGYNAPLFTKTPFVFTVHDLNLVDFAENSAALKRLYYRQVLRPACRRAAAVLTVSEFSKRRIVEWAGISERKVVNVGNGVSEAFSMQAASFNPGYPYILSVGNRKRHKNETRVMEAFARLNIAGGYRLLFSGKPSPELEAQAKRLGIEDAIQFMGHVDEGTMASLYRGARLLAFPSLYEGFGLPMLEAFACGLPVLTSNVTALPEVAGDAALLVNPESVEEIANAMSRLMVDETLRATLCAKGLDRVKTYTWAAVAGRVRNVLDALVREETNRS